MSITNSEHFEELLHECYRLNIIDDVRNEVILIIEDDPKINTFRAYEMAFEKISKKN